jgi:glycosyltransferase involved in cell wall biosynthesis
LAAELHKAGVKKVISWWGAPVSGPMPSWKLALKKLQVALARSKPDYMVFESQAMARTATHGRGYPAARTRVIHQGVDIAKYRPNPESDYVYKAFGFPMSRKVFVYSGHMEERKGVRTLVNAAIELLSKRGRQDVCFLFLGNRPGESAAYEKLYEGMGLDQWIRFGGYRDDLSRIFQSAYCGVAPSSGWDSFPYSPIEMAASGIAVIASNLQGLAEAVLDGKTGLLFEPGNAGMLADRIELLIRRPELARRFGEAGRARCESELNVEAQYLRTIGFMREILAR